MSADTDFGTLLAAERATGPSLLANLDAVANDLDDGAIVVVEGRAHSAR